ncbi:carbohydrate ABC transporter permease [Phytohabitans sp. ZYX-F-186]|uniref:Carbohydrate ABC transporter permease n=1 Tax=Phytohabitans maris TaxID=3071409 RepID=A0ABU0ZEE3_9ACTN|nr:carbohydrate ABC transporter permease [Phytohabitans sp. ZYX-F-186]MDQ7904794.1 carbohydrate ABC transporter permease [Phytohabitans sp. ZYX-F-186]
MSRSPEAPAPSRPGARRIPTPGRLLAYAVAAALVFVALFPIAWLFLVSFMPENLILRADPTFVFEPTLDHYRAIFQSTRSSVTDNLVNSIVVTVVSTVGAVALSVLAAYGLARLRPRGHAQLSLVILATRMLPPVALVVPLYVIANRADLFDTRTALIVPYIALNIPLATWMLQGFFMDLPRELEEAALVDGCNRWSAFWRVILPLAGPGIAAASIFSFILSWNDMVIALPLTLSDAVTLPPFASQVREEEGVAWGQLGAVTVLIMTPVIIFTLAVQRWIISGLTAGAAKG